MTAEPLELPDLTLDQLEVSADNLDIGKAAGIYNTFGCLVVRGLMRQYLEPISRQINQLIDETYQQFDQAEAIPEGWMTPNGCLLISAPETFERDKQIMCLPLSYRNSYRRADDYIVVNATSVANRTEAEESRDQARKDNQCGIMVRGFRAYDDSRDV